MSETSVPTPSAANRSRIRIVQVGGDLPQRSFANAIARSSVEFRASSFHRSLRRLRYCGAAEFPPPNPLREINMIKFNRRIAAFKPSATMAADQRAKEMRAAGIDVISLDAGEPDFDTPERIKDAARQALDRRQDQVHRRSAGIPELKEAIAPSSSATVSSITSIAEIMAIGRMQAGRRQRHRRDVRRGRRGNHSHAGVGQLFRDGGSVGRRSRCWSMSREDNATFSSTPDALSKAITPRTRAVLINSPSNPTGTVYSAGPAG